MTYMRSVIYGWATCVVLACASRTADAASLMATSSTTSERPQGLGRAEPLPTVEAEWRNGANRQGQERLVSRYLTVGAVVDAVYGFSFNRPVDDTISGSTVVGRHNELQLQLVAVSARFALENVHAALRLQTGLRPELVARNDPSVSRGQYQLDAIMKFISEGYVGYHFDVLAGINVDVGIFMSYVGLFSYLNFENWAYQPSYVSDNTPFYFQGARIQTLITPKLKLEIWLINGWQTYGKMNSQPGVGFQIGGNPASDWAWVSNGYVGWDTAQAPARIRLHSDSSAQWRYFRRPESPGLTQAALSLTLDIGGESGDGVSLLGEHAPSQTFLGFMLYHRAWFAHDMLAFTLGGGAIRNPGRYLVLAPAGQGAGEVPIAPGLNFWAWDASATFDVMPNDLVTLRVEGGLRQASIPYFSGRGGVTSRSGYTTDPASATYTPRLSRQEWRMLLAVLFRI